MIQPPLIETERLHLTWPNEKQINQYYADIVGTKMFDTILWDGPEDDKELHQYWEDNRKLDPNIFSVNLSVALINKKSKELIGGASLRPVDENHEIIDIGYALAPKFHGNGYATEAIRALVNEAFINRSAERVFATLFTGNVASKRVLEKNGFLLEGTLHHCVKKYGKWKDEWIFAITKPAWKNYQNQNSCIKVDR